MIFQNRTNSKILANLQIPTKILNQLQMTRPGWGLDILEALHHVISPEELIIRQKELKITDHQLERLLRWLECNCAVSELMKETGNGYHFSMIGIVDNNAYGLLTKIRRQLYNWRPQIRPNGQVYFEKLKWMENKIKLIFENEDTKLYCRDSLPVRDVGRKCGINELSVFCYKKIMKDEWYKKQFTCFQKVNGRWQVASEEYKQDVLDALVVMKELVA